MSGDARILPDDRAGIRLNIPFVEHRLVELSEQRETLAKRLREDGLYTPLVHRHGQSTFTSQRAFRCHVGTLTRCNFTRAGRRRLKARPAQKLNSPI
jgi:hypothetical protein